TMGVRIMVARTVADENYREKGSKIKTQDCGTYRFLPQLDVSHGLRTRAGQDRQEEGRSRLCRRSVRIQLWAKRLALLTEARAMDTGARGDVAMVEGQQVH